MPHLVFRIVGPSWEDWPLLALPHDRLPAAWLALLDEVAEASQLGDAGLPRLRSLFAQHDCLRPPVWMVTPG